MRLRSECTGWASKIVIFIFNRFILLHDTFCLKLCRSNLIRHTLMRSRDAYPMNVPHQSLLHRLISQLTAQLRLFSAVWFFYFSWRRSLKNFHNIFLFILFNERWLFEQSYMGNEAWLAIKSFLFKEGVNFI